MNNKISLPRLCRIIEEELQYSLNEAVDHASIRVVVDAASKMLAAVETFKENANGPMITAVTPHLESIEEALEDMVSTPGSYVEKKSTTQKVTLKPVDSDSKIV
jgi:hypothetical protein